MESMKSYPHIIAVEPTFPTGVSLVTVKSQLTGEIHQWELNADPAEIREWMTGPETIQDRLPYLSNHDREFLLTGSTPSEWNDLFGGEEDDA